MLRLKSQELLVTVFTASVILLVSASLMFYVESPTNDNFNDITDALWWAVTALTTVGYGAVLPSDCAV